MVYVDAVRMPVRVFASLAHNQYRDRMRGMSASEVLLQSNRFSTNRELELAGYIQIKRPEHLDPVSQNWLIENVGEDNFLMWDRNLWFTKSDQATLFLLRW
jgi:hypothetical protein